MKRLSYSLSRCDSGCAGIAALPSISSIHSHHYGACPASLPAASWGCPLECPDPSGALAPSSRRHLWHRVCRCDSGCTLSRTPWKGAHCPFRTSLPLRTSWPPFAAACHGLKWTVYSCWKHGLPAHLDLAPSEQLLTALGANEARGWLVPRWSHYATGDDVGRAGGSPPGSSSVKSYWADCHLAAYIAHQFTPSCRCAIL